MRNGEWGIRGVKIDDGSFKAESYQSADRGAELGQRSAEIETSGHISRVQNLLSANPFKHLTSALLYSLPLIYHTGFFFIYCEISTSSTTNVSSFYMVSLLCDKAKYRMNRSLS